MADPGRSTLDIVVPVYNEDQVVAAFHDRLMSVVALLRREHDIRIYYVNDGSTDGTAAELEKLVTLDAGVTIVELSRHFGHQAALTAGLDLASADAVVTLDGDGQHPPELITEMVALYRAGYDVVLTQRAAADLPRFKRWTSAAFYRFLSAIADTRITGGLGGLSPSFPPGCRRGRDHAGVSPLPARDGGVGGVPDRNPPVCGRAAARRHVQVLAQRGWHAWRRTRRSPFR